jgi:hypothetical protein
MLSPILGGLVVMTLGYRALFVVAAAASVVNLIASARLAEPRHRVPAPEEESVAV